MKTKQKTSLRNWKILQLRGCVNRIVGLIPEDALEHFTTDEIKQMEKFGHKVIKVLNEIKKTKTCHNCWRENKKEVSICKACAEKFNDEI